MDSLKDYLNKDVIIIIFEFFINGNDYDPFTLDDIKLLSKKITKWDECAQWASKKGHLEILEYISSFEKSIDWIICMEHSSFYGYTECVDFILHGVLKGCIETKDYYNCFDKALGGGNVKTVMLLEPAQDEDRKPVWESYMCYAAIHKRLEVVKYFGEKVVDLGIQYADKDWYIEEAEEGGDPLIIEYIENMFDW
uniref:Ankyrin repeat protein n=1 Tax=Pithovirus LCPAC401 TaxID=2506595 RepID=A0A481ZA26_9VIRU|nr:MAG: ankyrin repeat protein [Pithovirus LCPAC401]